MCANNNNLNQLSELQFLLIQLTSKSSELSSATLNFLKSGFNADQTGRNRASNPINSCINELADVINALSAIGFISCAGSPPLLSERPLSINDSTDIEDSSMAKLISSKNFNRWSESLIRDVKLAQENNIVSKNLTCCENRRQDVMSVLDKCGLFTAFDPSFLHIRLFQEFIIDNPEVVDQLIWFNEFLNSFGFVPVKNRHLFISRDYEIPSRFDFAVNIDLPYSGDHTIDIGEEKFYIVSDAMCNQDVFLHFTLSNSSLTDIRNRFTRLMETENARSV